MSNTGTLAFGFDGQIYTMPASGGSPKKVDIAVSADNKANNERIMAVNNGASGLVVVADAARKSRSPIAATCSSTASKAAARSASRRRPRPKRASSSRPTASRSSTRPSAAASGRSTKRGALRDAEPYFFASTVVKETPVVSNDHQNTHPTYSPDGKELAYLEDRNTLKCLNLATKQTRTLLTDKELFGGDHYFQWSPDSKWILFDLDVPGIAPGEVGLVRADGKGQVVNLTQSGFNDARGKWILGGKAMMWFSNRDGLKSVAQSGSAQQDAYAMFFDRDAWERFRLTKDEFALVKEADDKLAEDEGRFTQRRKPTPCAPRRRRNSSSTSTASTHAKRASRSHSSSLGDALVSKDGETLYYLARFERGLNLWSTNLRTKETKMVLTLNANGGNMAWDKDQKYIFLLADGQISRIDPVGHAEARHGRDERRGSARRRRRACGDVRSRVAPHARHVLLEGLSRHRLGRTASGLRQVSPAHRQQLRVRGDARRDAR